jgi:hypothetical protein
MNPILKNILAVIAGIIIGSIVNMALIMLSGAVIPPPAGVDPTDMESLKANMHMFEPRHYIFPFLAHAIGTFVGAFVAAKIASTHEMKLAYAVGVFFLIGGIANTFMLPAPSWFIVLDLMVAYLPMAWLGGRTALRSRISRSVTG